MFTSRNKVKCTHLCNLLLNTYFYVIMTCNVILFIRELYKNHRFMSIYKSNYIQRQKKKTKQEIFITIPR